MKQYYLLKQQHPGAVLLFRVGDFYETFGEDAVTAARILDITLTKRGGGTPNEIALAGFPHHALDNYLPKLVRAGQRVAICDQLEDPKLAKGLVKRGITELVTPGVSMHDNVLERRANNYLAAIHFGKAEAGISFLDISTGEFLVAQGTLDYLGKLLQNFSPAEVLFCKKSRSEFEQHFGPDFCTYALDEWVFGNDYAHDTLTRHFKTTSLKGFGVDTLKEGIVAAGCILHYLAETKHSDLGHVAALGRLEEDKYVWLDRFTVRNLELVHAQHPGGVPLIDVLDQTLTPMGARLLRKWIVLPLKEVSQIQRRLDTVAALVADEELLGDLTQHLRQINDLERLISKVAVRRVNPRELLQLARALEAIAPMRERLAGSGVKALVKLADQLNPCTNLRQEILAKIKPDAPLLTNQGGVLNPGIDPELDELRALAFSGKDYLLQLQVREQRNTGISSLKVAYNKVFGYYLEVTNAHKDKVPASWIRKQTLVNAERYVTEELKTYEEKILNAEEQLFAIEQRIYTDLVLAALDFVPHIQQNARAIGVMDCLASFALTARQQRYVQPVVNDGTVLDIRAGRHPVIERQLPPGESYIPNDICLNQDEQQIVVITGPNMAGKSALLRQTALIVLLAQIGSFVPADAATLGIIDKIFTRVGASDNLSKGESTFMVEMTETASILNNLSDRSLVLMDEIGRGTSTYDGISIAWAIVEHLHNNPKAKAKTLFATHYHELNQLADECPRVRNYNVAVKEADGRILFLRKLQAGGSEHSFGIHVARLAGMPHSVVLRANEIMHHLEMERTSAGAEDATPTDFDDLLDDLSNGTRGAKSRLAVTAAGPEAEAAIPRPRATSAVATAPRPTVQLSMFEPSDPALERIRELLQHLDINTLTPIEALMKLNELKLTLGKA
ncbi:DNA mismatch repair protein MutS [Hymenobacter sp. BT770]|uniref:DNA mismatch repair protein MutS n=1 Tax=Hymenobacter sp. BT770 TaxID=2886942 RepID=UPI001D123051|nr:DNA mismatch repair protein MutS [Hymenobacter sp. BT770]MCC3153229.1 DNA mismatch repair protein MutS [Hymenobacter sp. BT770]MDO3414224.1 DNA mismatch repair protein MutS [Hymenobacter sp. BT770]